MFWRTEPLDAASAMRAECYRTLVFRQRCPYGNLVVGLLGCMGVWMTRNARLACIARFALLGYLAVAGSSAFAAERCPLHWRADDDTYRMKGWSVRESDAGGPFRWTVDRNATIDLPRCEGAKSLKITMAFAVSESNLQEMRIAVNGTPVATTREPTKEYTLVAFLPAESQADQSLTITFAVPKLDQPAGADRQLGVAVRAIEMR